MRSFHNVASECVNREIFCKRNGIIEYAKCAPFGGTFGILVADYLRVRWAGLQLWPAKPIRTRTTSSITVVAENDWVHSGESVATNRQLLVRALAESSGL